ncbi:MAG: peptidylprolyl isomerase [Bacteroidales bacterium]|nr:peptidylprolyl isomerase [Bacteroidales bacterium]
MVVANEKVVSLIYELRLDSPQGEVIESLSQDNPLTFLFGTGNLLPKFEENINGLSVGDKFDFDLEALEAYGEKNEEAVVSVPVSAFEINGKIDEGMLSIGNTIPMRDNAGNRLNGVVKEVTDDTVVMDFNHPLAGNRLFFKGEVTEIREATQEELSHGHIHSGCGCGDGGCSDGHSHDSHGCGSDGCCC